MFSSRGGGGGEATNDASRSAGGTSYSIKSIQAPRNSVAMSELSVSASGALVMDDLHQSMDNIGQDADLDIAAARGSQHAAKQQQQGTGGGEGGIDDDESIALLFGPEEQAIANHQRPRSVEMPNNTGEEPNVTKSNNNDKGNNAKQTSLFSRILSELQCILDSDEKEQDPFAKRRLTFVFFVALISIVVNLVVIPLSLTRMEEKKNNYTDTPTTAPDLNPTTASPTTAVPSLSPSSSISPSFQGQTKKPTPFPTTLLPTTPRPTTTAPTPLPTNPPVTITTPAPALVVQPTLAQPQQQPTPQPNTVAVALPPYTLAALNNPDSPQSKAFQWLTADPSLSTYTSFRTLQRMSLATFFYATNDKYYKILQQGRQAGVDPDVFTKLFDENRNDDNQDVVYWTNASNWLSYEIHECFWFSQAPFVCDAQQNYRFLMLNNNGLVGRLPPELGLLTKLEQMHLSDNLQIYASIPTQISYLTQLRSLQLNNLPQLSGTIPDIIANLHGSLQQLHLRETPYIPKVLSTHLGRLTRLRELLLDTRVNMGSGVTTKQGTLPTELGNLRALQEFSITGQEVRGTLPLELAHLSNLALLSVCHTQIDGSIPSQYGNLLAMSNLELRDNRLGHSLPKELGHLRKSLTNLAVNDNQFVGTIPFQYSNLTSCTTMSFQQNQLTGTVPLGLCYLKTSNIIDTLRVDCNDEDTISASSSPLHCSCDCECY